MEYKKKFDKPEQVDKKCAEKVGSKTVEKISQRVKDGKIKY